MHSSSSRAKRILSSPSLLQNLWNFVFKMRREAKIVGFHLPCLFAGTCTSRLAMNAYLAICFHPMFSIFAYYNTRLERCAKDGTLSDRLQYQIILHLAPAFIGAAYSPCSPVPCHPNYSFVSVEHLKCIRYCWQ